MLSDLGETLLLQLPDAFAAGPFAMDETRTFEQVQMLRNGLAGEPGGVLQRERGERTIAAEADDKRQSHGIAERRKDRRGFFDLLERECHERATQLLVWARYLAMSRD